MATQRDLALQMIQQLRVLDPSISAEIGTPERKIIDTVAQSLADNQIDLALLSSAFDLDSKFGTDLDKFLAVFGFGRQLGTAATGYVKFTRPTVSNFDIPIQRGTQIVAPDMVSDEGAVVGDLVFFTTELVTLEAGELEVIAPIRCLTVGQIGNVAAGSITAFGRAPILGIVEPLVQEVPTTGGVDPESDNEFKVRFKNTVFRNLAGTQDQFLALAVSTQFTTKANVVGPISRYREYIQVPDVDDASADPDSGTLGNGSTNEYTSALSTVPYSKHVYSDVPYFIAQEGSSDTLFYRGDLDFRLNTTVAARDKGDTYRGRIDSTGPNVNTDTTTTYQPNVSFLNVYTGSNTAVQALRPKDVLLFEHSYMSTASRNDWTRQVLNCVDVYINGRNDVQADAVIPRPSGTANLFNTLSSSRFYIENYRRVGEPHRRPLAGNLFSPLYWTPVTSLPDTISTSDATYTKGVHYWPVVDVSDIGGTVRARCGIEWSTGINGAGQEDPAGGPFTSPKITGTVDTAIEVLSYTYDRNVIDLQVAMESNKQITSDVLAHQATTRYFKLDITAMYTQGGNASTINTDIQTQVQEFFESLYFGTAIQLSDILQTIHNVLGVDNVRWSRDILEQKALTTDTGGTTASNLVIDNAGSSRPRLVECDINGNPLLNILIDRRQAGNPGNEVQQFYLAGSPTGGTYKLRYNITTSASIAYNANAATVQTELRTISGDASLTVTGSGTALDPFIAVFSDTAAHLLFEVASISLTGGTNVFNADFFLSDDELPSLPTGLVTGDAVAGLVIRPRAQNTWGQL